MLTPQVESFQAILPELEVLFPTHWKELAMNQDKVPLAPIYEIYFEREDAGELLTVTLRESGQIRGYFIGFVKPHLHYRSMLTCVMDIFFVDPEHRNRRGGLILFRAVEKELKRRGVHNFFVGSKVHADASRLFEALKFKKIETYYSKWLGE